MHRRAAKSYRIGIEVAIAIFVSLALTVTATVGQTPLVSTAAEPCFADRSDAYSGALREGLCSPRWAEGFGAPGVGNGMDNIVFALTVADVGGGEALYAGGAFGTAGDVEANQVARWDGQAWTPLVSVMGGNGIPYGSRVEALAGFDDGTGPALYAAGEFSVAGNVAAYNIAKWDGESWSALIGPAGNGMSFGTVYALAVFDDGEGPALYAGGAFTDAGGLAVYHIAKWDGQAWSPLIDPSGEVGVDWEVRALTVFDDGGGPALYVGGIFYTAGSVPANGIAKWDGQAWSPLADPIGGNGVSGGLTPGVVALAAYDDGAGSALYVGGVFTAAGGVATSGIARWDGQTWSSLPSSTSSGINGFVFALSVFDDGTGPALYAGGHFTTANGVTVNRIAKWNGQEWSALVAPSGSVGVGNAVRALAVYDDDEGLALYAGGSFIIAGGVPSSCIARWSRPSANLLADFDCDGYVDLDDYKTLSECLVGPLISPAETCSTGINPDLDDDGDIDLADFAMFQAIFGGS